MNISLSAFAPENLIRVRQSRPASACSSPYSRCLFTGFLPSSAAASSYLSPYAIGSVPSLSGHANAYRWRSLPRVRRLRASKPQGSSKRVCRLGRSPCASLSHTHYWYEMAMLKVENTGVELVILQWSGSGLSEIRRLQRIFE